jgi:ribonucleases P/MRP protein subunit RPP25
LFLPQKYFSCRIEEYWDPVLAGLDPIVVTRKVPAIHILLTVDDIDPQTPGYQHADESSSTFWPTPTSTMSKKDDDYVYKNKRNFKGNNKPNGQQRPKSKTNNTDRSQNNQRSGETSDNKQKTKNNCKSDSTSQPQPGTSSQSQKALSG